MYCAAAEREVLRVVYVPAVSDHCVCLLREMLDQHGLTRAQLARASGIDPQRIWIYCEGRTEPTVGHALRAVHGMQVLTGKPFEVGDFWELRDGPKAVASEKGVVPELFR